MTRPRRLHLLLLVTLAASALAGCTGAVAPSPSPSPSPLAMVVESDAQAVALVLGSDARFAGVGPIIPDLVGQSAWYEVAQEAAGWQITVTMGWGDCPAGCIDRHTWRYSVGRDGSVELVQETGPELPADVVVPPTTGVAVLDVDLRAGPVCPVETIPPDPECEPRTVAGATVVVRDARGVEVARAVSDDDGRAHIELPAGPYIVAAEPVEGLMGGPEPVVVWALGNDPLVVTLTYDTGIR